MSRKNCFKNYTNLFNHLSCNLKSFIYEDSYEDFKIAHKLQETKEVKLPVVMPGKIKDKIGKVHSKVRFF